MIAFSRGPALPLKITFLLPMAGTEPIGGFKVVYEYANFLSARGHTVSVMHAQQFRMDKPLRSLPWREALWTVRTYLWTWLTGSYRPASWFRIQPWVRMIWAPTLAARWVPQADVVIATAWETAEWALTYPEAKGRKFYLIQHHETWSGPEDRVMATWRAPLEKIVIARWLQAIAEDCGQTAHLVHNGLDFSRFGMDTPPEERNACSLLMLFHERKWKGSADGLEAFRLARTQLPGLRLKLFGLAARPSELPEGVEYIQDPPQEVLRRMYNEAAIFLSPSWAEGFPLPPAEALQCGAALVSTDIDGTAMYAIDGQTALLSPVKDPAAMAANIVRAVSDPALRARLARDGNAFIQRFTWEQAGSEFERVIAGEATAGSS